MPSRLLIPILRGARRLAIQYQYNGRDVYHCSHQHLRPAVYLDYFFAHHISAITLPELISGIIWFLFQKLRVWKYRDQGPNGELKPVDINMAQGRIQRAMETEAPGRRPSHRGRSIRYPVFCTA